MKHLFRTLALIILVAGTTCFLAYQLSGDREVRQAVASGDALAWLRADFQLTDAQFARIKQLHESYSVVCEEHCRAIQEAARERQALRERGAEPAVLAAAERKVQELRAVCETAIAAHVRQCAAEMSPEAGQRYLALVLPKIADFDHRAPPDLQLNSGHVHR